VDITHDSGPHTSSDPTFTETWYWNTIDPKSGSVVWAHLSWLPAQRRGQHLVAVVSPAGVQRERVETKEPLKSELLEVDIVTPWHAAHIRSKVLDIDVRWEAFHDAVDFGELLHVDKTLALKHYESGGRAEGTIRGVRFSAPGWRDRSFGPRNVRRFGHHWAIGMIGVERDVMLTASVMWPDQQQAAAPPVVYGCVYDQGRQAVYNTGITSIRNRDGSPAQFRMPDQTSIALDISKSIGETRFILDPNSAPATDLTEDPVYALRDIYLQASSPTLGPLVGWYEEGVRWTN